MTNKSNINKQCVSFYDTILSLLKRKHINVREDVIIETVDGASRFEQKADLVIQSVETYPTPNVWVLKFVTRNDVENAVVGYALASRYCPDNDENNTASNTDVDYYVLDTISVRSDILVSELVKLLDSIDFYLRPKNKPNKAAA